MSGTGIAYTSACFAMSGTDIPYAATRQSCGVTRDPTPGIILRARYAMPGTDLAYRGICLGTCYNSAVLSWRVVVSAQEMRSTDLTDGEIRS
eukprot:1760466-Rhodomonas_salina.3